MSNFWDYSVWGFINLLTVLLVTMLVANILKRSVRFLRNSLIPTSVLGGVILLIISTVYNAITGTSIFNTNFFGGKGLDTLEIITYHALALGFIATTLKTTTKKLTKERTNEIFNTGITTVSTYLVQAVIGIAITIVVAAFIIPEFFPAAGLLLPFGYGQGTGQALNYGSMYEAVGFEGGKSFGLTIAALGFLSASIGGVIHLNILKKKGRIIVSEHKSKKLVSEDIQGDNEIPMNGGMDKLTFQLGLMLLAYILTYGAMFLLGNLLPGMKAVIYGFNFLLGVLMASLVKVTANFLHKKGVIKRYHRNNFLLDRIGNFFFDIMVIAGIAAIRLDLIGNYWHVLLVLGVSGAVATYFYNRFIARKLFPAYAEEQFLMMYGMLTGTASTGVILLRELDPDFKTPVSDNLVYQNFPAIVFGFPIMLLVPMAPNNIFLVFGLLVAFLIVLNLLLFRKQIFGRKNKNKESLSENQNG